jgi:hypothetical protein
MLPEKLKPAFNRLAGATTAIPPLVLFVWFVGFAVNPAALFGFIAIHQYVEFGEESTPSAWWLTVSKPAAFASGF